MADFSSGTSTVATDPTFAAKGDLLVGTADDAGTVLSVGSSNYLLSVTCCTPAWTNTPTVGGLTITGDITSTGATGGVDWDLVDNNTNALSFDASCQEGILRISSANCAEGVTMSGTLGVTGILTATGGLAGGAICIGESTITTTGLISGGSLDIDCVEVNGKVVTMTGSACDTIVMTVAANGAFSLVTTDTAAAAANIQITADGTVDIDSAGVLTLDSGAAINIEPASGSAVLIDGTVSIDGAAITGATSILATDIKIGEDDETKIDFADANIINLHANNIKAASLHNTSSKGDLRLYEACNYVSITPPALNTNWTLTLPANDGGACEFLQTDGCGVTSWAAASGLDAASQAQMEAASDNTVAATPGRTQNHPGVAKAWVQWFHATTISSSHNVVDITDNATTGVYDIQFDQNFASTGYTRVGMPGQGGRVLSTYSGEPATAGILYVLYVETDGSPIDVGVNINTSASVAVFGDHI